MEITDHQKNYIQIKDIGANSSLEFDTLLRRIMKLLQHMSDDISTSLSTEDYGSLGSTIMIDSDIDRLTDFCLRILNKNGYKDYPKTTIIYSLILFLELLGDAYKKIAWTLQSSATLEVTASDKAFLSGLKELYTLYHTTFFRFTPERALTLTNRGFALEKEATNEISTPIHATALRVLETLETLTMLRIDLGEEASP